MLSRARQARSGRGAIGTRGLVVVALGAAVLAASAVVPARGGTAAGAFQLDLSVAWRGGDDACPAGSSPTTECHPHTGLPVAVPGFGVVSESYLYPLEDQPAGCASGLVRVLAYPARLTVKGRGELFLAVSGVDGCFAAGTIDPVNVPQPFTVTGGSGVFAGASGHGVVSRSGVGLAQHAFGTDNWHGTFDAPAYVQDAAPPTIAGATSRTVRAPRGARTVRVRYTVTAKDDVDGSVPVKCTPPSRSRFKVGRRTLVHCSATDTSANAARAAFTITVRRSG